MAVFDLEADVERLDFRLMLNSFVTLFWRTHLLTQATDWMRRHSYTVVSLDASGWADDGDLHRDIAAALDFPAYYGRNLDALNDCMNDVVDYAYGTSREATGLLIAFTGYDGFTRRRPRTAQIVLDIMARQARSAMLTGHRILCLVQSSDPRITFAPVGATPVLWNHAEWLDAKRQPGSVPHPLLPE
jgi:hypothetical protein